MEFRLLIQFFGGRGQTLVRPRSNSGRTKQARNRKVDPNMTYEEAIGEPGDSVIRSVSTYEANPNYFLDRKWQINCQRCVWAYELMRRGYNVEAKPNTMSDQYSRVSGIQAMAGREFEAMGSNTAQGAIDNIASRMSEYGEGSRAFIMFFRNSGAGHIFMVEQTKEGTRFFDPQPGRNVDITHTFRTDNNVDYNSVAIMRTDDIQLESIRPGDLANVVSISKKNVSHRKG